MKHYHVAGVKLYQLEERYDNLKGLHWNGILPPYYSIHIFVNSNDSGGLIVLSDSFGGGCAWAEYTGDNRVVVGAPREPLTKDELQFLSSDYPVLLSKIRAIG